VESDGKLFSLTPRVLRLDGPTSIQPTRPARAAFLQRYFGPRGAAYFAGPDGNDACRRAQRQRLVQTWAFMLGRACRRIFASGIAIFPAGRNRKVERWLSGRVFLPFTPYTGPR